MIKLIRVDIIKLAVVQVKMSTMKRSRDDDDDDEDVEDVENVENVDKKEVKEKNVENVDKKKKPKKSLLSLDFVSKDLFHDSDINSLDSASLKDILKHHGLSQVGKKNDLKERILNQIPFPKYEPKAKSYEWDSSDKKPVYLLLKAKTGKGNCVRCLTPIDQGRPIVAKDTWDPQMRHAVQRKYHAECMMAFPPESIGSYDDIHWDESADKTLLPLVSRLFSEYHPNGSALLERETPIEHQGLRQESKELKSQGFTAVQAMAILDEKIV